jgi:small nuclear ribonucleoprotein (snRNP)-like protein
MFQPPYTVTDAESAEAVKTIQATFIGKTVRITATDRRIFEGRFVCVDSKMNVVLQGTYQYTPQSQELVTKQWTGMVMIPGKHVVSVAVLQQNTPAAHQFPQDQNLYI